MKIICVGRNYNEHIKELNNDIPTDPVLFMKPDSAVLRNGLPFYIPAFSNNVQHEVEVVIKINRLGKNISEKFAHRYYNEFTLGIDFTARDLQNNLKANGLPWEIAKSFDSSAVIGNFLFVQDFEQFDNLNFKLMKNSTAVQSGNTKDMLFGVNQLIAYASKYFTLKIGDLIFTGTPKGVAAVMPNDLLEGFIEDVKVLHTPIR